MKIRRTRIQRVCLMAAVISLILAVFVSSAYAEPTIPSFRFGFDMEPSQDPQDVSTSIQILIALTILSIAPSILIMMTSFTRIIIILSFLRNAMGTQQMPPNQVLIGLALFLTFFIMAPVGNQINREAFQPYSTGQIQQQEAIDKSSSIIKNFMLKQMRKDSEKDLAMFVRLAKIEGPVTPEELPLSVVVPAFLVNELTVAFKFGFLIFIPFLIIDLVVSSTLMSMGMMMLPPIMISLPFKILLFIMVGGWGLLVESIVNSFVM
ncbi:flagellar biosynthetic protein FliP [Anaerobacterium chartisolvens]|uniref:Flagellar biosynthetic protein FliP n=1 Tax=Anaerobacterium chartisolvens TaxID=1297424 RepID=A0A369B4S7_9FIRM|nr:flagellar type III secretion system pore protein FliP [Anaerobacterium chartisolvens]RCX15526.1 flagellar biosynthetic protein FliP [Anaerobacterium chartisolvens]